MYRHHPQTQRLAELVAEGAIGDLRLIRSVFSYGLFDESNIRLRTDVDGGCADGRRVLLHQRLAPARRRAGDASSAAPTSGRPGRTGRSRARCASPATCSRCSTARRACPNRDELEAIGSEGSLFLDDPWHCQNPVIELRRDGGVERIAVDAANPYQLEMEDLGRAIRTGSTPLLGRDDAVAQARVIAALRRSAADRAGRGPHRLGSRVWASSGRPGRSRHGRRARPLDRRRHRARARAARRRRRRQRPRRERGERAPHPRDRGARPARARSSRPTSPTPPRWSG